MLSFQRKVFKLIYQMNIVTKIYDEKEQDCRTGFREMLFFSIFCRHLHVPTISTQKSLLPIKFTKCSICNKNYSN